MAANKKKASEVNTSDANIQKKETATKKGLILNGVVYGLSGRCPEKLQIDGKVYSKKELLTNEEVLTTLVVGGSPFIKKI
jgi:hypothetical protein